MFYAKELVVLVAAKMSTGLLVAGVERETGEWVRLVREDIVDPLEGVVDLTDLLLSGKVQAVPYAIVKVACTEHNPFKPHVEDWLLDARFKMRRLGLLNLEERLDFLVKQSERDTLFALHRAQVSLVLIEPEKVHLTAKLASDGNLQIRLDFEYMGEKFTEIPCPDLIARAWAFNKLQDRGSGTFTVDARGWPSHGVKRLFLLISPSRKYKGKHCMLAPGFWAWPPLDGMVRFNRL